MQKNINMPTIHLERVSGDFGFLTTDELGHEFKQDASPEFGGNNYGIRPMQLLLAALAGCSAIDVISILKKQRQVIKEFKMTVEGEKENVKGKDFSLWKNIHIHLQLKGEIESDKATRAFELAINKYCSVAETLRLAGAHIDIKVSVTN